VRENVVGLAREPHVHHRVALGRAPEHAGKALHALDLAPRKRQKLKRSAMKMMMNQTTNSDDDTIT
jgi:hypothetical protein